MRNSNARRSRGRRAPKHSYQANYNKARIDIKAVSRAARTALPSLLNHYLPGGRVVGHEYIVRNPTRADDQPGSFKVNVISGRWADFATDARGGDVVSLVAYLSGCDQATAARNLARHLGVGGLR